MQRVAVREISALLCALSDRRLYVDPPPSGSQYHSYVAFVQRDEYLGVRFRQASETGARTARGMSRAGRAGRHVLPTPQFDHPGPQR